MSAIGIDIGNSKCTVAAVLDRKVTIALNDLSNRYTPSLVGFGQKCRKFGEGAKMQEVSNLRNTIHSLKRIIGLSYDEIMQQEKRFIFAPFFEHDGQVFFRVDFRGKEETFTAVQLMAILLAGLKQTAESDIGRGINVQECVLTVPVYYNEYQRRLMLEAASIAGLAPYKLMNDSSAVALEYGIYRSTELTDEQARNVVFVDMGHSATTATIVSFLKGKFEVKSIAYDKHFGGRDIDAALFDNYVEEFSSKYRIDIRSNPKAIFRLMAACERVKKILSANTVTDLNVECIMNDVDVSKTVRRDELEALITPLLSRLDEVLKNAIAMSKLAPGEIHSVELCGGSVRVPLIKERIRQFFGGKELSSTLNFDEAACNGATLQCAILSPSFVVREFAIKELVIRPIKCFYDPSEENPKDSECILFPVGSSFPALKEITFKRSKPFSLSFCYADDPSQRVISTYQVGTGGKIKVRVRLNAHGFVQVENALSIEETVVEEKDADGNPTEKKVATQKDAPLTGSFVYGIISDDNGLKVLKQKEQQMQQSDALIKRTENEKNSVEKYIYDMRIDLDGRLKDFASPEEKSKLFQLMEETENWLYNEGYDTTYEEYHKKSSALHSVGDLISNRPKSVEQLSAAISSFNALCSEIESKLASEACAHLSGEEQQQAAAIVATKRAQINEQFQRQSALAPWTKPVFTAADVNCIKSEVISGTQPILSKPKPVVEQAEEPVMMEESTEAMEAASQKESKSSPSASEDDTAQMSP